MKLSLFLLLKSRSEKKKISTDFRQRLNRIRMLVKLGATVPQLGL